VVALPNASLILHRHCVSELSDRVHPPGFYVESGTLWLIPQDRIPEHVAELPRNREVILYCT
jgi:hypothetical protein